MPRDISVTLKVDARFNIRLYDVPDDATNEQIESMAREHMFMGMEETSDPLRNAEYWDEEMVSYETIGGEVLWEK